MRYPKITAGMGGGAFITHTLFEDSTMGGEDNRRRSAYSVISITTTHYKILLVSLIATTFVRLL